MYESRLQPPLPRTAFAQRLIAHLALAFGLLAASLALGMVGYVVFEKLSWIDAFLNASMLLGGMGPVEPAPNNRWKAVCRTLCAVCGSGLHRHRCACVHTHPSSADASLPLVREGVAGCVGSNGAGATAFAFRFGETSHSERTTSPPARLSVSPARSAALLSIGCATTDHCPVVNASRTFEITWP